MNDRERARILDDSHRRLSSFIEQLPALMARIYEAQSGGYRSQSFDQQRPGPLLHCFHHCRDHCPCGQNTTIPSASDRTGETATSSAGVTLRRLDLEVTAIAHAVSNLHAIHDEHFLTSEQQDRLMHPDPDDPDTPICEVVARVKDKRGRPRQFEPMHRFSDVGGRLPHRLRLGKWAYDFVLATGSVPTLEQIEAHIDGRHVRRKAS